MPHWPALSEEATKVTYRLGRRVYRIDLESYLDGLVGEPVLPVVPEGSSDEECLLALQETFGRFSVTVVPDGTPWFS